ncbi:MAG TPA: hypothetical protein PK278_09245, partial [Gemmiger qucibialis]|nr:hypothetical protein [Gemmiger qucibialis]
GGSYDGPHQALREIRQYRIILSADTASEVRHLELCSIALESVAYSQTFAFLPRRDDGPPTTHFPSNFAFFSPYRPKIRYQALQSLKNHSKIKRYVL